MKRKMKAENLLPFLVFIHNAPDGHIFIIGNDIPQIEENILKPLQELMVNKKDYSRIDYGKIKLCGKTIYLVINSPHDMQKIRGALIAGVFLHTENYSQDFLSELIVRSRVKGAKIFTEGKPSGCSVKEFAKNIFGINDSSSS